MPLGIENSKGKVSMTRRSTRGYNVDRNVGRLRIELFQWLGEVKHSLEIAKGTPMSTVIVLDKIRYPRSNWDAKTVALTSS